MRAGPLLVAVALSSCTDALLQPPAANDIALDNRLSLRGRVCTDPPDPSGFPVKVIFLIDSSGSMCVSDGPGSQAGSGFCETIGAELMAEGISTPGRVRALHSLIDQWAPLVSANKADISVALVPFDSKVSNPYPPLSANNPVFVPANDGQLGGHIDDLQNTLGKGTDYQGALADAYQRIDADVQATMAGGARAKLPRTKYVVILLTDGTPYPRCTSDDNDSDPSVYATADAPWGIWRDNPATFCNPVPDPNNPNGPGIDPNKTCGGDPTGSSCATSADCGGQDCLNSVITDFVIGTDRNQNYQLFDPVDRLMTLKDRYVIGEVRLHTILLFNEDAVTLCGDICLRDLYNGMPDADSARKVAAWTLTEMAVKHGNGTFQEFDRQADIQLGSLDYTSLATRFVQKTLIADNTNAWPTVTGPVVDSDGDGVPDAVEGNASCSNDPSKPCTTDSDCGTGTCKTDTSISAGNLTTNHLAIDSDGDGFPDAFEIAHAAEGFDPLKPDPRGCKDDPAGTFKAKCSCIDTDGDGLSECMEQYLGTDPILADSDGDGIPDGLEVKYGLDPLTPNTRLIDSDLDGVADLLEIFQHTNPRLDDRLVHVRDGYQYQLTEVDQDNGSVCYDFLVSNIQLLTPDSASGQHGYNFITLTFAEAPEGGVTRDYGVWKQACVIAQFAPPTLRNPAGPEVDLVDADFIPLNKIKRAGGSLETLWPTNYASVCKGALP